MTKELKHEFNLAHVQLLRGGAHGKLIFSAAIKTNGAWFRFKAREHYAGTTSHKIYDFQCDSLFEKVAELNPGLSDAESARVSYDILNFIDDFYLSPIRDKSNKEIK